MTSSGPALALAGMAVFVAIVLAALLWRFRSASARFDRVLADMGAARQASEALDRHLEELRRAVEERVQGVERSLADGQKSLTEHLGKSGTLLQDVGEKMGRIYEASRKIEKLAGDVTRLEELLKPPKLRGTLGETFLEQALSQVLPQRCWRMQYGFGDAVVDAAIFLGDRVVAVDSKFPLENYRRSREAADEGERRRASRDFAADVRRHVDAIRAKYIRPEAGTCDFALMYVPAEAVYSEIAADGEEPSLADYAVERRVIPVSPRLLYAYLSTVAIGMRGMELQHSAQEIGEKLAELARLWEKVEEPFAKVGAHLSNTQKQYELAARSLDRFAARLEGVAESGEEKLDTEVPVRPSLPPS
ncbi:MAG TPA: DNA recombination protein RmuC [Thermoanaerobaculia bacterium]|nr:DNA recombination protein RmuC [Thermoanaerobaculia bacterium]